MKKKLIIFLIIIVVALIAFFAYTVIRDKITQVMITNIIDKNSSIKKQLDDYAAHSTDNFPDNNNVTDNAPVNPPSDEQQNVDNNSPTDKETSKPQEFAYYSESFIGPPVPPGYTPEPEETAPPKTKYKSFWDEPLVKSVYSRFSASEIAEVSSMSAGGFTADEKKRAKSILYGKVSSSEIREIQQLYNSYGGK